jgi:hypothetical protein
MSFKAPFGSRGYTESLLITRKCENRYKICHLLLNIISYLILLVIQVTHLNSRDTIPNIQYLYPFWISIKTA